MYWQTFCVESSENILLEFETVQIRIPVYKENGQPKYMRVKLFKAITCVNCDLRFLCKK